MAERPLGITILAVLWILSGILLILGGAGFAFLAGAVGGVALGALGAVIGIVLIVWGLVEIVLGYGALQGWPWVWLVGVILTVLSLIEGIYMLITTGWSAIISLIIAAIILYYLFQPNVKSWFGRS
ncbi:MAG: hypothetical protein ABFC89_10520 [Methanospirillum sp.]